MKIRESSDADSQSASTPNASSTAGSAEGQPSAAIALLAHELRVPVHALQAYLSVLLREQAGPLTDIQRDFLVSMRSLARRLERLTNDVQVMFAAGGSFSIIPAVIDLLKLVDDCRWELDPIAQGFGMRIDRVADGSGSWQFWADPVRLEQIVVNLIDNAIRYGAPGSTVQVRLRQSHRWLLLVVENEIVHDLEEIPAGWLQPSVRGATSHNVNPRGLGVGLSIVTQLVAAHRGQFMARVRDRRVAFAVRLPRSTSF